MKKFEEGIGLSRFCSKKLDEAQEKVEILLADKDGAKTPKPFQVTPSDEGDNELD